MKQSIAILGVVMMMACKSPMPVTGNPDDHTSTTGTAGSSKMTTQPYKPEPSKPVPDSIKIKRDTTRRQ